MNGGYRPKHSWLPQIPFTSLFSWHSMMALWVTVPITSPSNTHYLSAVSALCSLIVYGVTVLNIIPRFRTHYMKWNSIQR